VAVVAQEDHYGAPVAALSDVCAAVFRAEVGRELLQGVYVERFEHLDLI
jgi:hypothetical protein